MIKPSGDKSVQPRFVDLQIIPAPGGVLGVVEAGKHIGFPVRRMYFLTDLKEGATRGGHAHRTLHQCFICLRGAATIVIERQGERSTFRLDNYRSAMVLPAGSWRELQDFTGDALLAVLASAEYDEADYIRDYDEFRRWETERDRPSVPYLDLARYSSALGVEFEAAIAGTLNSGHFIGGPVLRRFESEFADYCGVSNTVGVGNGLQALVLALRAWGIGTGDEVILPANTFVATALAVSEVGATPVLVDAEADTGLIQTEQVAAALTPRTRAIIPVHLYGHPADMDPLRALAEKNDLFLLEDACQSHGARYKNRRCGALGDAAAFSFYPTKNLGAAGDAGALVTDDGKTADAVRKLANYGSDVKYHHELLGTNARLDPLQAGLLSVKLRYLDAWNGTRRAYAARYVADLAGIDGLTLPAVRSWADPVWHVFAVRVHDGRRADLQQALSDAGIGTNIHYPVPIHLQPCYSAMSWRKGDFPVSEQRSAEVLSLPLDAMHSQDEIDFVIEMIRKFFRN